MLKGMVALVTGGASGLGAATAKRILSQGGQVVVADLPSSNGQKFVEGLGSPDIIFTPVDVTSEGDVKNSLAMTIEKFGHLNACVNCAGIGHAGLVYKQAKDRLHKLDDFEKVLKVNALGTFNVCRMVVPEMLKNTPDKTNCRGVIINTASIAAFDGQMGQTAYSASKGAIVGMTLPMARDLSSMGIRVNAIAPGLFRTPLLEGLPADVVNFLGTTVPFPKQIGDPEWFGQLVESIITNPYLNAEVIRLDGALRMNP